MISIEFIVSAILIACIPGSGVIYTLSTALQNDKRKMFYAVLGCTLGIIPHVLVLLFSLFFFLKINNNIIETIKILGIIYLLYLAWDLFKSSFLITLEKKKLLSSQKILIKGFTLNILNPKLFIFLLAFIPQFINPKYNPISQILVLSLIFMIITFIVFYIYGLFVYKIKHTLISSKKKMRIVQTIFSLVLILISIELAMWQL